MAVKFQMINQAAEAIWNVFYCLLRENNVQPSWQDSKGLTHIFHISLSALNSFFALVAFSSVLLWKNVVEIVTALLQ